MTRNRLNMLLAVVAMVIVAVAGFFLGVQPQLAQAASDRLQRVSVDATNASTETELARLRAQATKLPEMQTELAKLQASVPSTANMSAFYSELGRVASASGVTVSAITTSDAVAYTPPAAAASTTDGTTASGTATGAATPAATATPAPTAAATAAAPGVTTNPEITASNFSVVPVSVSVDGSFDQALAFASGVQSAERLFLIDNITSTSSDSSSDTAGSTGTAGASTTTWTFAGFVYVLSTDKTTTTAGSATSTNG